MVDEIRSDQLESRIQSQPPELACLVSRNPTPLNPMVFLHKFNPSRSTSRKALLGPEGELI